MSRKKRYRLFVLLALVADMAAIGFLGYRYMDRKIPDELYVVQGEEEKAEKVLNHPLVTWEDSITASNEESYRISCRLLGVIPFKDVKVIPSREQELLVSGEPVGIYMETKGVLIIDTGAILSPEGISQDPAKNIVRPGDYIVAFNEQKITTKKELVEDIAQCDGETARLVVDRDGQTLTLSVQPVKDQGGDYKLGIWVRDNTQGIGTLTYVDEKGSYGALGHGISDVDTGSLLEIRQGSLYEAQILGIHKGSKGNPGELSGLIRYEPANCIGKITKNTENGIYGIFQNAEKSGLSFRQMPVGYKQDMEIGKASILCKVEDEVKEYEAEITRIDMNHEDTNKSFVIKVTDPELLSLTGGIVQGMSGSPVIQNGKIVGAVTHVFVQDAASGYGIFIENMIKNKG